MKNLIILFVYLLTISAYGADKKISELNSLASGSWASNDLFAIVDTSANETKKTTVSDFDTFAKNACVADSITNGVTNVAPSQNAVFDALALKEDASAVAADAKAAAVADAINNGTTDIAPSQNAVFDALALKQNSLTLGNLTGAGLSITGGTGAVVGSGASLALSATHNLFVWRSGTDAAGCGTISNPCHTVGYALTLVSSPASTNTWVISLLGGRNDAEVDDLLIPPYVFIAGMAPDVGSYLRLPSGKAIKLGSGWTVNGRAGIQNVYLGGSTSVNLDFAGVGGSAGSNFMFDDVTVTGSFTHTGRGVNGGDFVYAQNCFVFGTTTLTGSQLQSFNSNYASNVVIATSATVGTDVDIIGGQVSGNFSFTQSNAQTANLTTTGVAYFGTFATVGTVGLTTDDNLPSGYSLSGGTTRINTKNAHALAFVPSTSGNWNSVPALVGSALDNIGATGILKTQTANTLFAGPSTGSAAVPTFRVLAAADLPTITLTSDVTGADSGGSVTTTVASVGGSTASNVHAAELLANAATNSNTNSAIVKRDGSGNFAATTITAALTGNASTATALASNPSDCAGSQFATTIAANGDLTCAQVAFSNLSGTPTVAQATLANQAISASDINWAVGNVFTKTLGANTTFTFSNVRAGQTIVVRLTNTASNYTVTWPTVRWSGGVAPTMTVGAKSDIYTFVNDGSNTYGNAVQNMN